MCRLLGITRQGYYKHTEKTNEEDILISSVVWYCQYIRSPDNLPKAGYRELLELCQQYFGAKFTLERDRFYAILRANDLMLRNKKYHPRTTNSSHNNKIYPDLLNTSPKFVAKAPGELVVCDITYVYCHEGFGYLSLITDSHTRYIVGYCFYESLETDGPLAALEMAVEFYSAFGVAIGKNTIHHSDRDPLHNAMAERVNNTVKNCWMFNTGELVFLDASTSIDNAIMMYNKARPHQGIGMKTPFEMMTGKADNPLLSPKKE